MKIHPILAFASACAYSAFALCTAEEAPPVASAWKQFTVVRDNIDATAILQAIDRESITVEEFIAKLPPRYPKAILHVHEGDLMPRAGRPIANTRWEISIESQDGNYIIRESNRESTLSQKDRTARIEKGKDLPVVDAKKVVWYLYNKEDALCENWTLEQAPVPAEIHTVTYVVDMKAYCAESRGEEPKLSDLLHTTPPPRLPVKGNISFGWPRHPGYYFTPILRNGLFETEEAGSFDGGMRPVTYQWKNYATLLSAAKSKPESHPEEEWLADLIKLDLSYRKAFQPHLDAIAKMRFRAKQTTGNEAAAFAEEVLRQGEREQLLAGDPATLRSHPTLTELETHAEVGPNYKAYLDYNGKLVLFLFLPS